MELQSEIITEFIEWIGLKPGGITPDICKGPGSLDEQGFIITEDEGKTQISSPSLTGIVAGISELSEFGRDNICKPQNPVLKYRAHQRWLPFNLGQNAYGQAGYDCFDKDTDNWWYDRDYWKQYLFELARGRYNAIHLWNVHPYPVLIRFKEHPYAAYFESDRVEQNIEQFKWIVDTAKALGIKIVLMQYNIHVSKGYAEKHNLSWVDDCGWGGEDTSEIRSYTRACLEELFGLYPDLGGLMTAGELNKDAFDFYHETISPVLLDAESKPDLHFRLWGQQNPDGVRQLVDLMEGQIQLWHKISHEQIWVPKADLRIGKWHKLIPEVPINASCGPGMAPATNYQEKVHFDPVFVRKQFSHLNEIGGNGFGYFCGDDNIYRFNGDYQRQSNAIEARRSASKPSIEIAGKIGWSVDSGSMTDECCSEILSKHISLNNEFSEKVFGLTCAVNSAYARLSEILGMYNSQDLGFAGMLGRLSAGTEKEQPGSFCFIAGYAWPEDGFGDMDIPDVRQLAVDLRDTDKADLIDEYEGRFLKIVSALDEIIKTHDISQKVYAAESDKKYKAAAFVHYQRQTALTGLFKAKAVEAAIYAYRAPFAEDTISCMKKSVREINSCLDTLDAVLEQLNNGWAVYATERIEWSDFETENHKESLLVEKQQLEELINALKSGQIDLTVYKAYGRSVYWYNESARYLRVCGYHLEPETWELAENCIDKAVAELDNIQSVAVDLWRTFLQQEYRRVRRPVINLSLNDRQIELPMQWEGARFSGPLKYVEQMYQLLNPDKLKGISHCIDKNKVVKIKAADNGVEVEFPAMLDKHMDYIEPDHLLPPHEKVSPDYFRENDQYQFSAALPDDEGVFNITVIPCEGKMVGRYAWLNSPHGLKEKEIDLAGTKLSINDDQVVVLTVPWEFFGHKPQKDSQWRINAVQTRDFWQFVVASWSPVYDSNTFLDKEQLGFINWIK